MMLDEYAARVAVVLKELAISPQLIAERALGMCREPEELVYAEIDSSGKEHSLVAPAAAAWRQMAVDAGQSGVVLAIASAYRTLERQAEIIRQKLGRGLSLQQILCFSAPPGYSEHHSGCAVDVFTPDCAPLQPEFEQTAAYAWLSSRAQQYGFTLSYPRDNQQGYAYEPWHWRFRTVEV